MNPETFEKESVSLPAILTQQQIPSLFCVTCSFTHTQVSDVTADVLLWQLNEKHMQDEPKKFQHCPESGSMI